MPVLGALTGILFWLVGGALTVCAALGGSSVIVHVRQNRRGRRRAGAFERNDCPLRELAGGFDLRESHTGGKAPRPTLCGVHRGDRDCRQVELRFHWCSLAPTEQLRRLADQARGRRKWRRVEALFLLGWLTPADQIPLLGEALGDPDPDIAHAAAQALAAYELEEAYEALLDALLGSSLPPARIAAALETSRCEDPVPALSARSGDPDVRVRAWVSYLLGRTGRLDAVGSLLMLADDRDPQVRQRAAAALGETRTAKGRVVLTRLLGDEAPSVRAAAATAIGACGGTDVVDQLVTALRDVDWSVRRNAAEALESIGAPVIPAMWSTLSDRDRFARNKAAEVLTRLGAVRTEIARLGGSRAEAASARARLALLCRAEAFSTLEHEALALGSAAAPDQLASLLPARARQVAPAALASDLAGSDELHISARPVLRDARA